MSQYYRSLDPNPRANDGPDNAIAIFYIEAVQNNFLSEKEGRPIHEDREFVRIYIPGDNKTEVVREVTDADRERFYRQYEKFQKGLKDDEQLVGTRLKDWPAMTPAIIKDLAGVNIYTVEQLAGMSDSAVQNFGMGGLELRARAKAYLESAAKGAEATQYAAENERLKADIARLQEQIRDLAAQVQSEERRGPGRPRKEVA